MINKRIMKERTKLDKYENYLNDSLTTLEKIKILKDLYMEVKEFSLKCWLQEPEALSDFWIIKFKILDCENYLANKLITDVKPLLNFNFPQYLTLNSLSDEEILDYLISKTRKYLKNISLKDEKEFEKLPLTNFCKMASKNIMRLCKNYNINAKLLRINPGFTYKEQLYDGSGYHYFVIVTLNNQKYLLDATYNQFFLLERSILSRLGVLELTGCNPGIFMYIKEERKRIAEKILKDGWIKLESDTLKHYLDGFALSFRNGLYYEMTHDFSYETNYTTQNYEDFLNDEDTQLAHEGKLVLGYQTRPLKEPKLKF